MDYYYFSAMSLLLTRKTYLHDKMELSWGFHEGMEWDRKLLAQQASGR